MSKRDKADLIVHRCRCGSVDWHLTQTGRLLCAQCDSPADEGGSWDEVHEATVEDGLLDVLRFCDEVSANSPAIVREMVARSLLVMGADMADGPIWRHRVH
ncbi:MAG: hypothetical protein AAGC92_14300 [Pseudomonadota bacterium]